MNRRAQLITLIAVYATLAGLVFAIYRIYWPQLRGAAPVFLPPSIDIADVIENATSTPTSSEEEAMPSPDFPLSLPAGFSISIFAKELPSARVIISDSDGNIWVSQNSEGNISLLEIKDGKVVKQRVVFKDLRGPHGLAFDPDDSSMLYIAEEHRISRIKVSVGAKAEKIFDLPTGGHSTRTLGFGPDKRLYVSIGSSCNVCREDDERRAAIYSMNKDGSDARLFAKGLRNTVFFTWNPADGKMWGTDMGRDNIGDDIPPEEVNVIEDGKNYGWPICYGKNIHDTEFDKNTYFRNPCMEPFETASHIDMQAHSAPLGLVFVPQSAGWPAEYANDLLVAFHGSWNRSVPTGYKIARLHLGNAGAYEKTSDFAAGWLMKKGGSYEALGRPVGLMFYGGKLLVTDDKIGVIYAIEPKKL